MKNNLTQNLAKFFLLAFMAIISLNSQAQDLINVDFSTNPFVNGITTSYPPGDGIGCDQGYILGPNLNSICPFGLYNASLPAISPDNSPMCMAVNEGGGNNGNRILYNDDNLFIPAGNYTFCLVAAHRYSNANSGDQVSFNVSIGNNNPVILNLPFTNNQWTTISFDLNIPANTTGISIVVPNSTIEADYAVDLIALKGNNCTPSIVITSIEDRWCIKDEVSICGTFEDCGDYNIIDLDFFRDGQYVTTIHPENGTTEIDFENGTWCYTSPNEDQLITWGLEPGVFYDVIPTLNLNNSPPVVGVEFQNGQNNDLRLEGETEASVIFNHELTDLVTDLRVYCVGDPIFFHGMAEQSNRYHVAVRSRPIGSNGPFGNWQGAQEYGDFDGASWDLTTKYDFPAGFEYQITFGVSDTDNCIKWTPVVEILKVIECCDAAGYIYDSPPCSDAGNIFEVDITVFAPISEESINLVYSTSAPFEVLDWKYSIDDATGFVTITAVVETIYCTCEGEMLFIDIRTYDCEEVIWVMTPPIPCCESNCKGIDFKGADVDPNCQIVNGNKAFEFEALFSIAPNINVNNIIVEGTGGLCPSDVSNIQFSLSNGSLVIRGFVELLNPNCEWADIVVKIDTDYGCCEYLIPFSLPWECDEKCLDGAPTINNIIEGEKGGNTITVSINGEKGTSVTIIDNITGETTQETIGIVKCGPFQIDKNGNLIGVDCTGYSYNAEYDCGKDDGDGQGSSLYDFTIIINDCVYQLVGDYCDIQPVGPVGPSDDNPGDIFNGGKFSDNTSIDVREDKEDMTVFESKIFPNPMLSSQELTIESTKDIQYVRIVDIQGKMIFSQYLDIPTSEFVITNLDDMLNGLYFVHLTSIDKEVSIKKLSIIK